jgi:hypothetical protein
VTETPEPVVVELDPLPDLLADHTLLGRTEAERLREHVGRWAQLVRGLWGWRDRAVFALRYVARRGTVRAFLAARPATGGGAAKLRADLDVLLHTHRLVRHTADPHRTPAAFRAAMHLRSPVFLSWAQLWSDELWKPRAGLDGLFREARRHVPEAAWKRPAVVYPWRGAGGPFLLPLESLVSQPATAVLSVYLVPTALTAAEREWLAGMASCAQSLGEQQLQPVGTGGSTRLVDPAAALAGKLYTAHARRLTEAPFLVLVQCAADGGADVVESLGGAAQAVVHEPPVEPGDPDAATLPTGVRGYPPDRPAEDSPAARRLYDDLDLTGTLDPSPLGRLPLLTDAAGAATLFRLPVSIRGGVPGIAVRQLPPEFHPGQRLDAPPPGVACVTLGRFEGGGRVHVPVQDLTRHTLVTGFTGSGKTVTVLQLLHQLWADHGVPFLVLESAKQEYRGLVGVPAVGRGATPLRVYTVGNEGCAPVRLNPFELLPGVRVEAHVSRLQVCFEAAVPPFGPSVSVIAEALHRVYEECGWGLTDVCPAGRAPRRTFPTLRGFMAAVEAVIADRGYLGETRENVRAALVGRFRPLVLGSKGQMFDTQRSDPDAAALFGGPVVLEMHDLNLDEKALAVMFLLTLLREHRERHPCPDGKLVHVTVVEEAHNVLAEVGPSAAGEGATKADTRHKAVEAFCGLLAEIRSLGEGLVISDQSPQKLARDAIRNTNLQLAHQLRDGDDRRAMANAMVMDDEQREYLGRLDRGCAAVFRTGMEKATFLTVDRYYGGEADRGWGFARSLPDDAVRRHMLGLGLVAAAGCAGCHSGCGLEADPCPHRDTVFPLAATPDARRRAAAWFAKLDPARQSEPGMVMDEAVAAAVADLAAEGLAGDAAAVWCHFVQSWHAEARAAGREGEGVRLTEAHLAAVRRRVPT